MTQIHNVRSIAAVILLAVIDDKKSLNTLLPLHSKELSAEDKAQLQNLCFGACRHFFSINALSKILLDKPLPEKGRLTQGLLWIGLYQLAYSHMPEHAAIHQTVAACDDLKQTPFKKLVNALLRRFQREKNELLNDLTSSDVPAFEHPKWLLKKLKKDWPENWQDIARQANRQAPMALRVNTHKQDISKYIQTLKDTNLECHPGKLANTSVYLAKPTNVFDLPGFTQGYCSVQDEAAQLAGQILAPKAGESVLDACCAPGGKTGHLLEYSHGQAHITALDSDAKRLQRVHENLERLGYSAKVLQGEAQAPENWWDGKQYDAILLDVPCSATGVIRRHPDIKLLRQREDIDNLAQLQQAILIKAWDLLKPGGRLLYATCSITQAENQNNIEAFLQTHSDSSLDTLNFSDGLDTGFGWQFFPNENAQDGFFYALLRKKA